MEIKPVKLKENRVWRTYTGGKYLEKWLRGKEGDDSSFPEDWIASVVTANNGKNTVINQGLSRFINENGEEEFLKDFIQKNPKKILGERHFKNYGENLGILLKFIDAGERLSIQVHPSKKKAKILFDSEYGKTEAWYILGGREIDGELPHIYGGFKPGITEKLWREYFEKQDIHGMLDCMHKIYVKEGETYLIEGGIPHAIGGGCLILEIQEPTDYTIRVEKTTSSGSKIEDIMCHQGLGYDRMFQCFEWENYSKKEFLKRYRYENCYTKRDILIGYDKTSAFSLEKLNVYKERVALEKEESYYVLVGIEGEGILTFGREKISLKKGEKIFIPALIKNLYLSGVSEKFSVLKCNPPKDKI